MPLSAPLERAVLPQVEDVVRGIDQVLRRGQGRLMVTGTTQAPVAARRRAGGDARALQSVIKSFNLIKDELVEQGEATASDLAALVGGAPQLRVSDAGDAPADRARGAGLERRGVYRPGFRLVKLSGAVVTRFDERQLAMPVSSNRVRKPRKLVHLSLRRSLQAVFIERLPTHRR